MTASSSSEPNDWGRAKVTRVTGKGSELERRFDPIDLTSLPPELAHDPLLPDALLLRARYLPHPWYEAREREDGMLFWLQSIRSKINMFRQH